MGVGSGGELQSIRDHLPQFNYFVWTNNVNLRWFVRISFGFFMWRRITDQRMAARPLKRPRLPSMAIATKNCCGNRFADHRKNHNVVILLSYLSCCLVLIRNVKLSIVKLAAVELSPLSSYVLPPHPSSLPLQLCGLVK